MIKSIDRGELLIYEDQLKAIHSFHEKHVGNDDSFKDNIKNNLGKTIEDYKVEVRRLKKINPSDQVKNCINRAELCLKFTKDNKYLELIKRSMKRKEICIGNEMKIDSNNKIELDKIDINKCCYDMVEFDVINYLCYLRKKDIDLNWKKMIKKYCELEGLNSYSEKFIMAMVSYPKYTIKFFTKLKKDEKKLTETEYEKALRKAIKKDNESLI